MKQLFLSLATVALLGATANANFVIDTFDDTSSDQGVNPGIHDSSIGLGTTVNLEDPNSVATMRTLVGRGGMGTGQAIRVQATTGLESILTVDLNANESASIEWALPSVDVLKGLLLDGFNITGSGTYDVEIDGIAAGSGNLGVSGLLNTDGGLAADSLKITFTAGDLGLNVFLASSVTSTPEPASMGLLGLALFGGVARRRKRRQVA